jgi:hypothetical protein
MELGNAFSSFQPELRTMLRDAAARQDNDATALAEIDADKAFREGRLAEIDAELKKAADAGSVPHRALPAYERAYRTTIGFRMADGLQAKLMEGMERAAKNGDAESVIREVLPEFEQKIAQGDFYGRQGFQQAASAVINQFKQQVTYKYAANYEKNAEYIAAQQGNALVLSLAAADTVQSSAALTDVKTHLDNERLRSSPHSVNSRFLASSVEPAFKTLIAEKRYDEARALKERLAGLDLTGNGGLFGKTTEAQSFFAEIETVLNRHTDETTSEQARLLQASKSVALDQAAFRAAEIMESRRSEGFSLQAADIDREVSKWADTLPNDQTKAFKVQALRKTLEGQLSADRESRRKVLEPEIGQLFSSMDTFVPEELEKAEVLLSTYREILTPSEYANASQTIKQRRAQGEVVSPVVQRSVFQQVYVQESFGGLPKTTKPYFSDKDKDATEAWDKMTDSDKEEHQSRVREFILNGLRESVATYSNPEEAKTNLEVIKDGVTKKAQEYSRKTALDIFTERKKRDQGAKIQEQAKIQQIAQATAQASKVFDIAYTAQRPTGRTGKMGPVPAEIDVPEAKPGSEKSQANVPPSERDFVRVATRSSSRILNRLFEGAKDVSEIDLPALAKQVNESKEKGAAAKSLELYGVAKGILGYTPEEIKSGVTKHGIGIPPKAIDPRYVRVFRDRAELEKHWNNGQPTELFMDVGNRVADPDNNLTSEKFYRLQAALLSTK